MNADMLNRGTEDRLSLSLLPPLSALFFYFIFLGGGERPLRPL